MLAYYKYERRFFLLQTYLPQFCVTTHKMTVPSQVNHPMIPNKIRTVKLLKPQYAKAKVAEPSQTGPNRGF